MYNLLGCRFYSRGVIKSTCNPGYMHAFAFCYPIAWSFTVGFVGFLLEENVKGNLHVPFFSLSTCNMIKDHVYLRIRVTFRTSWDNLTIYEDIKTCFRLLEIC